MIYFQSLGMGDRVSDIIHIDTTVPTLSKQDVREKVWSHLEIHNLANYPRPVHNRIPNFVGAATAGQNVAKLEEFQTAKIVKVNPDKPQEEVRYTVHSG